jgi:hypothetical protein
MAKARSRKKAQPTPAEQEAAAIEAHMEQLAGDPATEFDPAKLEAPAPEHAPHEAPAETLQHVTHATGVDMEERAPDGPETTHHAHKRFGTYRDSKQGIRIDKETERQPGQNGLRVLISFRDKPSDDERAMLKAERFNWDGNNWWKPLNGANVETAKRVVNEMLKGRGDDYQLFV